MRYKYVLAIVTACIFAQFGFSQAIETVKEVDSKTLNTFKVTGDFGGKPKVISIPGSTSWKLVREADKEDLSIVFVPTDDEKGVTFTFLAFGAKDGKPIVAEASTKVKNPPPPTPVPTPVPTPTPSPVVNKYSDALKAAYLVNPDKDSLKKLVGALNEVKGTTFSSFTEASTVFKNTVKTRVDADGGTKKLPKLRDAISYDILAKEIGDDGDEKWDQAKFIQVLTLIIEALTALGVL